MFQVNSDMMCSVGATPSDGEYPTAAVLNAMKANQARIPGLKWQYFGSEKGIMSLYPAKRDCNHNFDPRFR